MCARRAPHQKSLEVSMVLTEEQKRAIQDTATKLGVDPTDLAAVISYETAGTFSPSIRGGKNNKYLGLIQFGPQERRQYGVGPDQTFDEQMGSVGSFLQDRGVKPGMGLLDLYSTVNAGSPGHYSASDRPGQTVASHVVDILRNPNFKDLASMFPAAPPVPGLSAPAIPGGPSPVNIAPAVTAQAAPVEKPKGLLGLGGPEMGLIAKIKQLMEEKNKQPGAAVAPTAASMAPGGGLLNLIKMLL